MSLSGFLLLFGILVVFVAVWYALSYLWAPHLDDPDGYAKVAGNCGDTMELAFRIRRGQVAQTHCWTDGCTMSRNCIDAAARLASGKDVSALAKISMMDIVEEIGSVPDTHLHCAQLAETTLQQAVGDYFARQEGDAAALSGRAVHEEQRRRGKGTAQ
ncbi:MAG: iron-sulfur cluster assembly scaffold protein [Desulfofustis sp.]|nr:iron-sulfur cluster assembly scaffold protein [Desulfofustis sp.]